MTERELKARKKFTLRVMVVSAIFVFGVWAGWGFWTRDFWENGKLPNWGLAGDSFGGLNALFSALAILGAIYAIILQREDFRVTLKEYSGTKKAQETVAKIQAVTTQIEQARYWLKHEEERRDEQKEFKRYAVDILQYILESHARSDEDATFKELAKKCEAMEVYILKEKWKLYFNEPIRENETCGNLVYISEILGDTLQVKSLRRSREIIGEMEELDGELKGYKLKLIEDAARGTPL